MATPTVAANAYANLAQHHWIRASALGKARREASGPSFASVLKDAIGSVLEAGRKSDAQTVAMASGKANVDGRRHGGRRDRGRGVDAGVGARQA